VFHTVSKVLKMREFRVVLTGSVQTLWLPSATAQLSFPKVNAGLLSIRHVLILPRYVSYL
jgi:hypothetical protein